LEIWKTNSLKHKGLRHSKLDKNFHECLDDPCSRRCSIPPWHQYVHRGLGEVIATEYISVLRMRQRKCYHYFRYCD
jgi:hypothetical protein